jgi:hypothetical protein
MSTFGVLAEFHDVSDKSVPIVFDRDSRNDGNIQSAGRCPLISFIKCLNRAKLNPILIQPRWTRTLCKSRPPISTLSLSRSGLSRLSRALFLSLVEDECQCTSKTTTRRHRSTLHLALLCFSRLDIDQRRGQQHIDQAHIQFNIKSTNLNNNSTGIGRNVSIDVLLRRRRLLFSSYGCSRFVFMFIIFENE